MSDRCTRCNQMELEYVDLHAQYNALADKYRHAAQENVANILRFQKLQDEFIALNKDIELLETNYEKACEEIAMLKAQIKRESGAF